jgi:hypothetical protein
MARVGACPASLREDARWLKARGTRLKTRASRVEGGARDGERGTGDEGDVVI